MGHRPARRRRAPGRDEELKASIVEVNEANYEVYGAVRMQRALRREKQIVIGRDQTARLMRALGLKGVRRGAFTRTTVADEAAARPADLVDRQFHAERPDQLWIVDLILPQDLARVRLPRPGHRCVEPPHPRLGDGHPHAHRPAARGVGDGDLEPGNVLV